MTPHYGVNPIQRRTVKLFSIPRFYGILIHFHARRKRKRRRVLRGRGRIHRGRNRRSTNTLRSRDAQWVTQCHFDNPRRRRDSRLPRAAQRTWAIRVLCRYPPSQPDAIPSPAGEADGGKRVDGQRKRLRRDWCAGTCSARIGRGTRDQGMRAPSMYLWNSRSRDFQISGRTASMSQSILQNWRVSPRSSCGRNTRLPTAVLPVCRGLVIAKTSATWLRKKWQRRSGSRITVVKERRKSTSSEVCSLDFTVSDSSSYIHYIHWSWCIPLLLIIHMYEDAST